MQWTSPTWKSGKLDQLVQLDQLEQFISWISWNSWVSYILDVADRPGGQQVGVGELGPWGEVSIVIHLEEGACSSLSSARALKLI